MEYRQLKMPCSRASYPIYSAFSEQTFDPRSFELTQLLRNRCKYYDPTHPRIHSCFIILIDIFFVRYNIIFSFFLLSQIISIFTQINCVESQQLHLSWSTYFSQITVRCLNFIQQSILSVSYKIDRTVYQNTTTL